MNIFKLKLDSLLKKVLLLSPFLILMAVLLLFQAKKGGFPTQPKEWMKEQVSEDLSHFVREDLEPSKLTAFFEDPYNPTVEKRPILKIQIIKNKLYWHLSEDFDRKSFKIKNNNTRKRLKIVCGMIHEVLRLNKFEDMEFLVNLNDNSDYPEQPIFCFAKKSKASSNILIPDYDIYSFLEKKDNVVFVNEIHLKKNEWENKNEVVFWRGSSTGRFNPEKDWKSTPRASLVLLAKENPSFIDAKFTSFTSKLSSKSQTTVKELGLKDSWIEPKEMLKYKYLAVPDGNTCAFTGYFRVLLSNSVPIKQESEDIQWFYKGLKPFVHFVPVASDFSNLEDRYLWLQNNDLEARKIAENSREFAKDNLMKKNIHTYVIYLLKEYARLQNAEIKLSDTMKSYKQLKKVSALK